MVQNAGNRATLGTDEMASTNLPHGRICGPSLGPRCGDVRDWAQRSDRAGPGNLLEQGPYAK